jgi:hypothetical protein
MCMYDVVVHDMGLHSVSMHIICVYFMEILGMAYLPWAKKKHDFSLATHNILIFMEKENMFPIICR